MKKRVLNGVFLHSLGNRLFLYFTSLMVVPLVFTGILVYLISVQHISDIALQSNTQIVDKVAADLDGLLSDMSYIAGLVDGDELIDRAAQTSSRSDATALENARVEIEERLRAINEFRRDIDAIYLRLDNGLATKSRYYPLRDTVEMTDMDYARIKNRSYDEWTVSPNGSSVLDNQGAGVLSVASAVRDATSGRPCGVVIVELRLDTIETLLDLDIGQQGALLLLDAQNQLMCASPTADPTLIDAVMQVSEKTAIGNQTVIVDQSSRILLFRRMANTGWVTAGALPKSFLRQNGRMILGSILLIALLSLIGNMVISGKLRDYELRPIRSMISYVRNVRDGHFGQPLDIVRDDEIGELAKNILSMSSRIGTLLDTVKLEQEQLRIAEFKTMQAQINPHFLYNTLDSIAWLSCDGRNQQVVKMVHALTTFFRISLSRGKDIITVEEEVRQARSYLTIQKMRYTTQFDYMIYVDPAVEHQHVPKLILQPLVENALYHGIKACSHKCMLFINVLQSDSGVLIEVLDNGVGMQPAQLHALQNALERKGDQRAESFGMLNVHDRIRTLTRGHFTFSIQSELDVGTSIAIHIESLREESTNV